MFSGTQPAWGNRPANCDRDGGNPYNPARRRPRFGPCSNPPAGRQNRHALTRLGHGKLCPTVLRPRRGIVRFRGATGLHRPWKRPIPSCRLPVPQAIGHHTTDPRGTGSILPVRPNTDISHGCRSTCCRTLATVQGFCPMDWPRAHRRPYSARLLLRVAVPRGLADPLQGAEPSLCGQRGMLVNKSGYGTWLAFLFCESYRASRNNTNEFMSGTA